jgi:hypothetical protein
LTDWADADVAETAARAPTASAINFIKSLHGLDDRPNRADAS